MKIIVIVRTLNESKNIDRFCKCYRWADRIIVADGGSTDDTVSRASWYSNVETYQFEPRVDFGNGMIVNPRGKHINSLIGMAKQKSADWIIFDDCDCVPNIRLQLDGRTLLESAEDDMVFAYRMFILGNDRWFPDMNLPGQSLWAWRWNVNIEADEENPLMFTMNIPEQNTRSKLEHPWSLLHYFYPDEETIQRKKRLYVLTGEVPEDYSPMSQFGRIEELPAWARWQ